MDNLTKISTKATEMALDRVNLLFFIIFILLLSGCNTQQLMTKKEGTGSTAARTVPDKINEIKQQQHALQLLIINADVALSNYDFGQADKLYSDVLALDVNNLRAQEGRRRVAIFSQHAATVKQAKSLLGKSVQGDQQAAGLLRSVLIEDPKNVNADRLYKKIIEKADAKRIASLNKKLKYQNPVTLEFRDTEIKVIIQALAKGTGVNFTLDKDVKKSLKASLFIRNVSLEEAIDILVQSNQLRKKVLSDNLILIYPDTALKIRQYQDLIIRSFYLEYADPTTVSNLLKSMLSISQIQVDDRLPMIMIRDVPEVMILAEKLIKSQDVAEPEVMLEMNILEVRRAAITDVGIVWPTQFSVLADSGLTLQALKDVSSSTIGVSPNPSIVFNGDDSNVNLLANPRIRVKNRGQARIHIGDRVPVITSNVSSNGTIVESVQYIDTGLKLDVEPEISMAGDISIKLNLDVSSIVGQSSLGQPPQIGTRSTSTQLRLKDGETQVLAGLISDEDKTTINKIPGLGDLPLLGRLFSRQSEDKVKTELVLTITPHIIRNRQSPDAELAEYWIGTQLQVGRGMAAPAKRTREEISQLFKAGVAPGTAAPSIEPSRQESVPENLNIQLPAGLTSQF